MQPIARIAAAVFALNLVVTASPAAAQNRALNQPTFASSVYSAGSVAPSNAVDGNTDGNFYHGSIFHSGNSAGDWWYVDLGQSYDINQINYWNRTDCCGYRIIGATIGIFTAAPYQSGSPAPAWSAVFSAASGATDLTTFLPPSVAGQFVGIQAPSSGDAYLQIAELEAFGNPSVTPPSTAPEPASWLMLATGLGALGLVTVRRRARV